MRLFSQVLSPRYNYIKKLQKASIKLQVIGQKEKLSKGLQKVIKEAEELTKDNKEGILNLAINYGGRAEILEAVRKIIKKKIPPERVGDKVFEENLWTGKIPAPDLIIRTSGEMRLSGFLLWQATYSELYFTEKFWPDFTEKDLDKALNDYALRQRRFGH
jgi:undecaprenyl diphosphate synthase